MSTGDDNLCLFSEESTIPEVGAQRLAPIQDEMRSCKRCSLHEVRNLVVPGRGCSSHPLVAFVGEAPASDENSTGVPFVGKAGKQLEKMMASMGLSDDEVFLVNVLGCQPPDNRLPTSEEFIACKDWLVAQLRAVGPEVIVTLGQTASQVLLNKPYDLSKLRGKWKRWDGIPVMPTHHPAFLLKKKGLGKRKECWSDLKQVMTLIKQIKNERHTERD